MKKLGLIFFVLLLSCGVSFANEEVWLDINTPDISRFNTGKLQYENQKLDYDEEEENYLKPSINTMKKMFDEDFYKPRTVTTKKEKKFGKTTFGTRQDTKLQTNDITQTNTMYAKQEFTEKMSVGASYKNNGIQALNNGEKGAVSVAPEYKFNKKTSLKNIYSKDLNNNSNKQEVQLNYKPFDDGRMDFSAGAGQVQRDNGGQTSSQVNFGTNFRF